MASKDRCLFELWPVGTDDALDATNLLGVERLITHQQPAARVVWLGSPRRGIRVYGIGEPEVAPGLLARISELCGTPLRVSPVGKGDSPPK